MSINKNILRTLKINLNYQPGETVAIITQEIEGKTRQLTETFFRVLKENQVNVELITYQPLELRNGVDVTKEVYQMSKKDILFTF